MTAISLGPTPARRDALAKRIRLLVAATITYNVIEAVVAITAGTIASSTALIGFGLDSVIEVSSAAAVAWQFSARDHAVREAREKTTLRIIAVSFFALAAYVSVDAVRALTGTGEAERSIPGIVIAALSLAVMPFLSAAQRRAGRELGSASARSPTPSRPCCAPTSPRCSWSAWSSTPPSAGPGPTRSPPWSSPPSQSRKAATPGRARAAARPPPRRPPSPTMPAAAARDVSAATEPTDAGARCP